MKGMSLAITETYSGAIDGFNMAQAGTKTFNLSSQARRLVVEMRQNPNVDFHNDWKMVTILVGKKIAACYGNQFFLSFTK